MGGRRPRRRSCKGLLQPPKLTCVNNDPSPTFPLSKSNTQDLMMTDMTDPFNAHHGMHLTEWGRSRGRNPPRLLPKSCNTPNTPSQPSLFRFLQGCHPPCSVNPEQPDNGLTLVGPKTHLQCLLHAYSTPAQVSLDMVRA